MLEPGTKAPDFILPDQAGARIRLAAYHGKPVVLFFYPRDNSRGCTKEACAFRDDYSEFRSLGAAILGVSRDDSESHAEFRKSHDLPFPLLSDTAGEVARKFGVPKFLGMVPGRTTFVIGAGGIIRMAYSNMFNAASHSARALDCVRSLADSRVERAAESIGA